MYRVLITGTIHQVGLDLLYQASDLAVDYRPELPMEKILATIAPYHCIISRSETAITRELIDRAPELKVIARAAVGIGNIDVEYATEKGILVINTPGKNTNSAAELTMGLLLAVMRKICLAHHNMQQEKWDRHRFSGNELRGKTLGIVGLGNVGHRMARFGLGFEMKVIAYDPYISDEVFEQNHVQKVDWPTLLTQADVVSVHVPKNKETTGMIKAAEIAKMKPGVILLNAARGGIIQESAMLEALHSGHVAGAGVDTWDVEPPKDNPFRHLPQVIMTPHIGASTEEAQILIAQSMGEQVPRALRGEVVDYPVNMPQIKLLDHSPVSSYVVLVEKLGSFASQFIDFVPHHAELKFRGSLAKQDCSLLRLAFIKGFLKRTQDYVSYVNAEQRAESAGLKVSSVEDPGFRDYESAVKCTLSLGSQSLTIGGVVFSGNHPRITLVNGFFVETEPSGTILVSINNDRPGMIGVIGTMLGKNSINISQFNLSRNLPGGRAMALIGVDADVSEAVLDQLRQHEGIVLVKKITI